MSRRPNAIFQASDTKLSGTCRISFEPNMVVHHVPFIVLPARGERRFGLAVKAATFYSCASMASRFLMARGVIDRWRLISPSSLEADRSVRPEIQKDLW